MKLHEFMIAEQFHTLLDGLGRQVVGLHLAVERKLKVVAAPGVSWRMETGDTGFFRAILGKRRDFLLIEHERLREYSALISGRAFGTALHVSWLLIGRIKISKDVRRAVRVDVEKAGKFDIGAELDLFDMLDLSAFVALTRLALTQAIRELTESNESTVEEMTWPLPSEDTE